MEKTFGEVLRRLRGQVPVRTLARRASVSKSLVSALENHGKRPSASVAASLDAALNAGGELIAAYEADASNGKNVENREFCPPVAAMGSVRTLEEEFPLAGEDATERRRLLQLAAGLGAVVTAPTEALRQLIDLDMRMEQTAEDWALACADHLHALHTRPAAEVQQDLHLDLVAVLRQVDQVVTLRGPDHAETRELYRVLAAMAALQANVLTRLGQHGAALRWWRTARKAADTSADLHLALGIRFTEAGNGLASGQRDPATVLALIDSAGHLVHSAPDSYGTALLQISRVKALSMLGRHDEAVAILDGVQDQLAAGSLPVGIMPRYWRNTQLGYAQVWVYSGAGLDERAMAACAQVLRTNVDYQYIANTRLHAARCTIAGGGIDAGIQQAAEVLDGIEPVYRTHIVKQTAEMVIRTVPVEQRDRPLIGELRSMLAIEAR